jgi:hypothetical protein
LTQSINNVRSELSNELASTNSSLNLLNTAVGQLTDKHNSDISDINNIIGKSNSSINNIE